ncbi:hypothetical protein EMIT0324P_20033 [Pseudomonas chlororaphis]
MVHWAGGSMMLIGTLSGSASGVSTSAEELYLILREHPGKQPRQRPQLLYEISQGLSLRPLRAD